MDRAHLAFASGLLAAFSLVACAGPEVPSNHGSGASASSSDEAPGATSLADGGLTIDFAFGESKTPTVAFKRGDARVVLSSCTTSAFVQGPYDDASDAAPEPELGASLISIRCADAPAQASEICRAEFAFHPNQDGGDVSLRLECESTKGTLTNAQRAVMRLVAGADVAPFSMGSSQTAVKEQTFPLPKATRGTSVAEDPVALAFEVTRAASPLVGLVPTKSDGEAPQPAIPIAAIGARAFMVKIDPATMSSSFEALYGPVEYPKIKATNVSIEDDLGRLATANVIRARVKAKLGID